MTAYIDRIWCSQINREGAFMVSTSSLNYPQQLSFNLTRSQHFNLLTLQWCNAPCNKRGLTASHVVVMCLLVSKRTKTGTEKPDLRLICTSSNVWPISKKVFLALWGICRQLPRFHLLFPNMSNIAASREEKRRKKKTPLYLVQSALEKIDHRRCCHGAHMLTFLLFNVTDTHRRTSCLSWQNNLNFSNSKQASTSAETGLRSWPLLFCIAILIVEDCQEG